MMLEDPDLIRMIPNIPLLILLFLDVFYRAPRLCCYYRIRINYQEEHRSDRSYLLSDDVSINKSKHNGATSQKRVKRT